MSGGGGGGGGAQLCTVTSPYYSAVQQQSVQVNQSLALLAACWQLTPTYRIILTKQVLYRIWGRGAASQNTIQSWMSSSTPSFNVYVEHLAEFCAKTYTARYPVPVSSSEYKTWLLPRMTICVLCFGLSPAHLPPTSFQLKEKQNKSVEETGS